MSRWKKLSSQEVFKTGFFRMRVDKCELPDGRVMPQYYVLEFPDWVNVLPVTTDNQVVLVRQYRYGADEIFLEIPGGSTDPRHSEDPRVAGERELLEETGYKGREWVNCGFHYPNPALQGNRMHTFLALGCEKVAEQNLDPFEDLELVTMPFDEFIRRWYAGEFPHSLIASSIGAALRHLRDKGFKVSP